MSDFLLPIEARSNQAGTISGLAYSGGLMRVGSWGLVAVDLGGVTLPKTGRVPVCLDHSTDLQAGVIGVCDVQVGYDSIRISGELNEKADSIRAMAKDGIELQMSIGCRPTKSRDISAGAQVQVNGRTLTSNEPWRLIEACELYEISVVLRGADHQTYALVARQHKENNMAEPNTQDILAQERARIRDLAQLGEKYGDFSGVSQVLQAAIETGDSVEATKARVLELVASSDALQELRDKRRANHGPAIHVASGRPEAKPEVISAAILASAGHDQDMLVAAYGEKVATQAKHYSGIGYNDAAKLCLEASNQNTHGLTKSEILTASGTTTYSLPEVLRDAMHKSVERYFSEAPATWKAFCSTRSVSDFRTHYGVNMHTGESLQQVANDGELKHIGITDNKLSYSVDTWGSIVSISRQDLVNDNLSFFSELPMRLGRMAQRTISDKVVEHILSNTDSFWSAGNGNYFTGAGSALDATSFEAAYNAMIQQVDPSGNVLDLMPRTLLVPPELRAEAIQLMDSEALQYLIEPDAAAASTSIVNRPSGNPWRNAVQVVTEARLSSSKYANASATGWYLFASPMDSPILVAFLNGKAVPTIESEQVSFERLGMQWRCYIDFGVARGHKEASVYNVGA